MLKSLKNYAIFRLSQENAHTSRSIPETRLTHEGYTMSNEAKAIPTVSAPARSPIPYQLIAIFSALTICIVILGFIHFYHEEKRLIKQKQDELSAIADLKVTQIANWRLERMSNAREIFSIPLLSKYLYDCELNPGDTRLFKEFQFTLETLKDVYRLESVLAIDTKGNVVCSCGKQANVYGSKAKSYIEETLKENKIIFSDLQKTEVISEIHMGLFVPMNIRTPEKEIRVGVILLRIDPNEFLYPLIKSWPNVSKTGETLLVDRQGDEGVFLSELRFNKDSALNLKFQLNSPDLPAAMAVQGIEKAVFGKDYRGENVLAVLKKIPDSPWSLVSKIDMKELRAPLVVTEWFAVLTIVIFILFAAFVVAYYWNKKDADYYHLQYQLELDRKALVKNYKYITEYANDIIILAESDGKIVEVNNKAVTTFGYSKEELLKMSIKDIRAPGHKQQLKQMIEDLRAKGGMVYETMNMRNDGTEFPVEVSMRVMDIDGKPYIHGIARDITERKTLEQRMESFFTGSPAGMCIIDNEFRWVKINKKMADINGYSVEEHIGKTFEELLPKLAPQLLPMCKAIVDNGKSFLNMEISGETPRNQGHIRHWISSYFPVPGIDIRHRYVGCIVVEVTDLKKAQEELGREFEQSKKYLDIAGVMFLVLDREGRVLMLNKKGVEMTGYSENELFGKNWFDVCVPSEIKPKIKAVFHEVTGGTVPLSEHTENEVITKNGEHRTVAFNNILLKDDKGHITGTLSSGEDITERRKAEEKILKLNEELESRVKERTAQLEEANKYLESFSFSVSHDLRAPLRAIDGFSRILIEDHSASLDVEAMRLLNVVRNNTQNMGQLIDDLLKFSQISRHELVETKINMEEMVKSVIADLEAVNPGRKINFIVQSLKGAWADASVIRQVFINLLANSVKFTSIRQEAVIEIGCEAGEKENTYFVRDNGVGFDMQYKDKLFGVFQRLHNEEKYEGTGIGLALVERVIKRHGGRVWAEGKPGEGAVFYFTLPV